MPAAPVTRVQTSPPIPGLSGAGLSRIRGKPSKPRRSLVNWLNRNRRLAVALLLCAAAGMAVQQLTPAPALTQPVFAAARDLPAGKILADADVTEVRVPQEL